MYLQNKELYIDNDILYVSCPACTTSMKSAINGASLNVLQCKVCKEQYNINVNRRKHLRKSFKEIVIARCFSAKKGSFNARLLNISRGGLKLAPEFRLHSFKIDDFLRVKFTINDVNIELMVQIANTCTASHVYCCIFNQEYSPKGEIEKVIKFLKI